MSINNKLPAMIGNVLEWFDFFNYAYLAPIIATLFFPTTDRYIALIATFSVFAASYLVRPIGGAFFGYIGDKYGRKRALAASIIAMGIPTTLIGFLPTHAQWGIYATIAIFSLRLLQGFAAGGELAGSMTFMTEHATPKKRGFDGSLVLMSTFAGILLSSATTGFITHQLTNEQLFDWGWRIPFLVGFLVCIIGIYIRLQSEETPVFQARTKEKPPIKQTLKDILHVARLNILPAVCFYIVFVYFSTYMKEELGLSLSTALAINSINIIALTLLTPLFGLLTDKWGRKPVFYLGFFGYLILSLPLFYLLEKNSAYSAFITQFVFTICAAACYAPFPAAVTEAVNASTRYFSVAMGFNLTTALLGSTAPIAVMWLIQRMGHTIAPSIYLTIAALISILVLRTVPETKPSL